MLLTTEELNVIKRVKKELHEAESRDTIYKIYRQSRNWSRYHCHFAEACSPEIQRKMNHIFKHLKNNALEMKQFSGDVIHQRSDKKGEFVAGRWEDGILVEFNPGIDDRKI